eukprot:scaffold118660_cov48-Phaeocystis_antarctica.AAC.2
MSTHHAEFTMWKEKTARQKYRGAMAPTRGGTSTVRRALVWRAIYIVKPHIAEACRRQVPC